MPAGTSRSEGSQIKTQGQRRANNGRGNEAKNVSPIGPIRATQRFGIHSNAPTGHARLLQAAK